MANRSHEWDGVTTGKGKIVVYGRNSIRQMWDAELNDEDRSNYESVHEFEQSSMYPFTSLAIGEYPIAEILWDEDVETIVVIVDD